MAVIKTDSAKYLERITCLNFLSINGTRVMYKFMYTPLNVYFLPVILFERSHQIHIDPTL